MIDLTPQKAILLEETKNSVMRVEYRGLEIAFCMEALVYGLYTIPSIVHNHRHTQEA